LVEWLCLWSLLKYRENRNFGEHTEFVKPGKGREVVREQDGPISGALYLNEVNTAAGKKNGNVNKVNTYTTILAL
jgi:hypothetical protein